jgi:hypothetical protein
MTGVWTTRSRRIWRLSAVLCLLAACGLSLRPIAPVHASYMPAFIILNEDDVPHSFHRGDMVGETNGMLSQESGFSSRVFSQGLGRVDGDLTWYTRTVKAGLWGLIAAVSEFRTTQAAHNAVTLSIYSMRKRYRGYAAYHDLPTPSRNSFVITFLCPCAGHRSTIYFMETFRSHFTILSALYFTPGMAQRTMLDTVLHYQGIMVKRTP